MDNFGSHDIYLILPELSLAGLAALIVVVDLAFRRRDILPFVALAGLAVPLAFSILLWFDLNSDNVASIGTCPGDVDGMADSGVYMVHPAAAIPVSAMSPATARIQARKKTQ